MLLDVRCHQARVPDNPRIGVLPKAGSLALHPGRTLPWGGRSRLEVSRAVEAPCFGWVSEVSGCVLSSRCSSDSRGCLLGAQAPGRDLLGWFRRCLGATLTASLSPQCRSGNHLCSQLADHLVWARSVRLQARRAIIRLLPGLPPPDAHLFCCRGRCWLEGRGWVNQTTAGCWGVKPPPCCALGQRIPSRKGRSSRKE